MATRGRIVSLDDRLAALRGGPPPSPWLRRRDGGRLVLLPARGPVWRLTAGMIPFCAGVFGAAALAYYVFGPAGPALAVVFGLFGLAAVALTIFLHRRGSVPLTIDDIGRVRFGDKVLVAAGRAREVVITLDTKGEANSFDVHVHVADGKPVALPGPYFSCLAERSEAQELAAAVAEVLKVQVVDQSGP